MNSIVINSAKYYEKHAPDRSMLVSRSICAKIEGKNVWIPIDLANIYYLEIMRQVESGTLVIEPADDPETE